MKFKISSIALVISNLIPLFGVIFWKWDLSSIIFIYWLENLIIGLLNILKIKKSEGEIIPQSLQNFSINNKQIEPMGKAGLISFFIFHYGIFSFVHGMFVLTFFGFPKMSFLILALSCLSIFLSHFVSYLVNYVGKGEYLVVSPNKLFMQPYSRVVILHLTIIFGGMLATSLGSPVFALVFMIILKIIVDLWLHNKEHKKFEKLSQPIPKI